MLVQLLERLAHGLFVVLRFVYGFLRARIARAWSGERTAHALKGQLPEKPDRRRAAIVAIGSRPEASLLPNLLGGFAENDFFVLVVSTGILPDAFKNQVLSCCHFLLEKTDSGYAGCFKAGRNWTKNQAGLKNIDTLALANDTLYYPRRIASTIGQMLGQDGNWKCLFETAQTQPGCFQLFRASVFTSAAFSNFWRDYAPSPLHRHMTAEGETDFIRVLSKAGFTPRPYYTATRLRDDVSAALATETVSPALGNVLDFSLKFARTSRAPGKIGGALALSASEIAQRIDALMKKEDSAYAAGLLCNYFYQAPVKRDICLRSAMTESDLLALVQGFSAEEKEIIRNDLRRKAIPANFAGMRLLSQAFRRTGQLL